MMIFEGMGMILIYHLFFLPFIFTKEMISLYLFSSSFRIKQEAM
jgi:hypothetical protein